MKALAFLLLLEMAAAVGITPAISAPVFSNVASAGATAGDSFSDPATEARARNLQRQLRCLVCQGESIDESGSPFAADVRHLVRQQIAEGQSDRQIEDFLVARYGAFILMKPAASIFASVRVRFGCARPLICTSSATDCGLRSRMMARSSRFSGVNSRTTASTELKLALAASAGAGRSPRATVFISSRRERRL